MEAVFITIHDLSLDARIKFCSDSIVDILGYNPSEVKGKSCWEYFHPDEIPFAKSIHTEGLDLDKAAVVNYCQMRHKNGSWINCECVFTVVYDVLVASTSVFKRGPKARRRALEGAHVRQIFSSFPKDPRYYMLSFLSNKFYQEPKAHWREPRAALFLNRFTRSSSIMFATSSVSTILGLSSEQLIGKSFYYCVTENCLADAVKCVESAKSNDSIAYLRFCYRDPTLPDARRPSIPTDGLEDEDEDNEDSSGGLDTGLFVGTAQSGIPADAPLSRSQTSESLPRVSGWATKDCVSSNHSVRSIDTTAERRHGSSRNSKYVEEQGKDSLFDLPAIRRTISPAVRLNKRVRPPQGTHIEIDAVVSCSSDSLVVVIRRAHPLIPNPLSDIDDDN
ncbi:hypothetical protein DV736_g1645, partial [Chaetothyriales sp. CBS 134916]